LRTDPAGSSCQFCGGHVIAHDELFDLEIAHVDCDAFFASVERLDAPHLEGRPIIVGGKGDRGVVATACYIARRFGVRSAMPMARARTLCPEAVILTPRFDRYREISRAIRAMMEEITPQVQMASLDEAYLDIHGCRRLHNAPPAVLLARLARRVETEIGVTISVGLSHAPFLAKIASDLQKPAGFSVIGRSETLEFLGDKPVTLIGGVGPKTERILSDLGIRDVGALRRADPKLLATRLGSAGLRIHRLANGIDCRRIEPNPPARSISSEQTFDRDISGRKALERAVWTECETVAARAKGEGVAGTTVTLRLKLADHRVLSRQMHLDAPTQLAEEMFRAARALLDKVPVSGRFRLAGVGLSDLSAWSGAPVQGLLFDDGAARREAEERAIDAIRAKFGAGAIVKGRSI